MFTEPPYQISYTAPGWPLDFEPPRVTNATYFNFLGGAPVGHWPDFSNLEEAYSALWYVRQISPNVRAEIYNMLDPDNLPPGVGPYPVRVEPHNKPGGDTTSVWVIAGTLALQSGDTARILAYAGALSDAKQGLYSMQQGQYLLAIGATWDDWGNQVSGPPAWPWEAMYAYVSHVTLHSPGEAQLYWGVEGTGPALGGLPY